MFNIIAAMWPNRGIGLNGRIPWKCTADMKFFKQQTQGSVVIMGRKTWESLPYALEGRKNVVITSSRKIRGDCFTAPSLRRALNEHAGRRPTFVIGGEKLYKEAMHDADEIYLTRIPAPDIRETISPDTILPEIPLSQDMTCDTFFPEIPPYYGLNDLHYIGDGVMVEIYKNLRMRKRCDETKYLNLLKRVMEKGVWKENRTGVRTKSLCNQMLKFSFGENGEIPVITTKKMFLKGIVLELIWFLNGNKDVKWLQDRGVHIWDGNSSREYMDSIGLGHYKDGYIGPMYGAQWISWGGNPRLNQFADILQTLKTNPNSRRMVMSAWNVADLPRMALPPCHVMYIFNVQKGKLNCHLTLRSSDLFLGLPFNITSTAIMTALLASAADLKLGEIAISIADAHIYETHFDAVQTQLNREPLQLPTMEVNQIVNTFEDMKKLTFEDFSFEYHSWPSIKAPMVV
jgi:dihydrofolate reductase/thymidylate synthase